MIDDYSSDIDDAAKEYGIDPQLLKAHLTVESHGNPNAYNDEYGAAGMAQIIPSTAKSLGVKDPYDPKQAIEGAAKLIAENTKRYPNQEDAIMAYHGGTNKKNWGPKTEAYKEKVMAQLDNEYDPFADTGSSQVANAEFDPFDQDASSIKAKEEIPVSIAMDLLKTAPSAVVKGIGAIPQIPAMAGNSVANAIGYTYGKLSDATDEQQNKLDNLNPFFTGNTPLDALYQAGSGLITGDAGKSNPLTGDALYNPQTMPGRFENALIQGGVAGPAAGIRMGTSLGGTAGAEVASEAFPGNPLAPLVGGAVGGGGINMLQKGLTPEPLPTEVADVFKRGEKDFGIKVPSSVMTGGKNLVEKIAGKADTEEMTTQLNKTAADLIGANDSGGEHSTINQKSWLDAKKNNSEAYKKLDSEIGDVPLDKHIGDIAEQLKSANQPRFDKVSADIYSRLKSDGSISPADIRELIGHGSNLRKYANSANEDIAEPAQNLIATLKIALKEKATPEQLQKLSEVNNKYKLMSDFEKIARESGAGSKIKPEAIRDVINKSYSGINDFETPAKDVGNLLNTAAPKNSYSSEFGGMPSGRSSNFLPNAELGASFLMGEVPSGLFLKYAPKAVSGIASKYINSDLYRNKLLQESGY